MDSNLFGFKLSKRDWKNVDAIREEKTSESDKIRGVGGWKSTGAKGMMKPSITWWPH